MSAQTPLVAPPKKRGRLLAIIAAAVVVVLAIIIGISVANSSKPSGDDAAAGDGAITEGLGSADDPVKIGVVGASDPYWDIYKDAAADAGISVDIVDFTDYAQPNPALTEGDPDLVPVGATAIYPLGLYSTKYTSVDDIEEGETVAIPNDASNLARALLVLQASKLVELKDGGSPFSTVDDVLPSSKVKVTTLDAALTPTSLPDVAAAIINNDFVADAGLSFDEAIASDDPDDASAKPYINIFAARAEDKNDPVLSELVQLFQNTKAVTDGLQETSGDTATLATTPVDELEATLKQVQADYAKQ
jgi:D-methionine transport system substrate-binding protein